MGTPGYLAPEVIEGSPAARPPDVHSWGGHRGLRGHRPPAVRVRLVRGDLLPDRERPARPGHHAGPAAADRAARAGPRPVPAARRRRAGRAGTRLDLAAQQPVPVPGGLPGGLPAPGPRADDRADSRPRTRSAGGRRRRAAGQAAGRVRRPGGRRGAAMAGAGRTGRAAPACPTCCRPSVQPQRARRPAPTCCRRWRSRGRASGYAGPRPGHVAGGRGPAAGRPAAGRPPRPAPRLGGAAAADAAGAGRMAVLIAVSVAAAHRGHRRRAGHADRAAVGRPDQHRRAGRRRGRAPDGPPSAIAFGPGRGRARCCTWCQAAPGPAVRRDRGRGSACWPCPARPGRALGGGRAGRLLRVGPGSARCRAGEQVLRGDHGQRAQRGAWRSSG